MLERPERKAIRWLGGGGKTVKLTSGEMAL